MNSKISSLAKEMGIDENTVALFVDLFAMEVQRGVQFDQAVVNVHTYLTNLAAQAALPKEQQEPWFRAFADQLASEVYDAFQQTQVIQ